MFDARSRKRRRENSGAQTGGDERTGNEDGRSAAPFVSFSPPLRSSSSGRNESEGDRPETIALQSVEQQGPREPPNPR
jgi:hypothetical protein